MSNSNRRRHASPFIALTLACIMMSASFVGSLDSAVVSTSGNNQDTGIFEGAAVPFLEDMPLRMVADLVYDSESDRIIFFGGSIENLQADFDDTWSFDYNTNNWTNMNPAVHPPASEWSAVAYHSGQDRVVLFGGHISGSGDNMLNHNQTWVYDYNTNTWTEMSPAIAPPASTGVMVYDSESDLIVLSCQFPDGAWSSDPLAQTWTYDLSTDTWTNVTTSGQPSPRTWFKMAYDSESDLIVAHGGFSTESANRWEIYDDTWTYDTNTNTWTEIATVGPGVTGDLAYDSESDRIVFFGGCLDMSEYPQDLVSETWNYDTNSETWEKMTNDVQPPKRSRGELVYDSESDRVILFEGLVWSAPIEILHDCWVYDLNTNLWNDVNWDWQEMTPVDSPYPTQDPVMAYDTESDLTVLFRGYVEPEGRPHNETWSYDYNSNTWTNLTSTSSPPWRFGSELVYDEESDIIILFGGLAEWGILEPYEEDYNDTWAYDVNTNAWTNMLPTVAPSARAGHSMTYDSKSDRIILFGGSDLNDTWTYDYNSNTWSQMSPAESPSARGGSVLVYDEESEVSVLFGGDGGGLGLQSDTWVYNSTADSWTEMSPSYYPSKRARMTAIYHSTVDRIIMFGGGLESNIFNNETWSYDYNTNTWFEMNTPSSPSTRKDSGLAFDSESNRTILFGGDIWTPRFNDTWAYRYQINPPPPPENLEVSDVGDALGLTWEAPRVYPETPVTGYNVYRGISSGVYHLLTQLGDVLYYTDTTVARGTEYFYVVTAETNVGESSYSGEVSDILPTTTTTPTPTQPPDPGLVLITLVIVGCAAVVIVVIVIFMRKR